MAFANPTGSHENHHLPSLKETVTGLIAIAAVAGSLAMAHDIKTGICGRPTAEMADCSYIDAGRALVADAVQLVTPNLVTKPVYSPANQPRG